MKMNPWRLEGIKHSLKATTTLSPIWRKMIEDLIKAVEDNNTPEDK